MNKNPFLLQGTYLASDIAWLYEHAALGDDNACRCKKTGARINSCDVHRFRAETESCDAPFRPETDLQPGNGKMISFKTLWCSECGMRKNEMKKVFSSDLVFFKEKRPA